MRIRQNLRRAKWQSNLGRHFLYQALVSLLRALALVLHFKSIKSGARNLTSLGANFLRSGVNLASATWGGFLGLPWGAIFTASLGLSLVGFISFSIYVWRAEIAWNKVGSLTLQALGGVVLIVIALAMAYLVDMILNVVWRVLLRIFSYAYDVLKTVFGWIYRRIRSLSKLAISLLLLILGLVAKIFLLDIKKRDNHEGWEINFLSLSVLSYSKNSTNIFSIGLAAFSVFSVGLVSVGSFLTISLISWSNPELVQAQNVPTIEASQARDDVEILEAEVVSQADVSEPHPFEEDAIRAAVSTENVVEEVSIKDARNAILENVFWRPESALEVVTQADLLIEFEAIAVDQTLLCSSDRVVAVGMASPSGSWLLNQQLARKRAQSLARLVIQRAHICQTPPLVISASFVNGRHTAPRNIARALVVSRLDSLSNEIEPSMVTAQLEKMLEQEFQTEVTLDTKSAEICVLPRARLFAASTNSLSLPSCQSTW